MNLESMRWATSLAAGAAVLIHLPALAADRTDEPRSVVVTATRYALPVDEVLPATFVIEREELQRSLAADIADVLRFRAGLEFGRNGGVGQNASLFLRGTESNHTLVLVDGVRINPGTIGGAAFQNLSPELVERIEVVKGPRSTLYGTDAIGGVVQIFTHAASGNGIATQAGYGTDNTLTSNASLGWNSDDTHLGLGVNYLETDGFAPRKGDSRGGAYDNLSVNLAGSTQLGAGKLGVTYWRSSGSSDYIGFSGRTFDSALQAQDYTDEAGTLSYSWSAGTWQSKLEVGRMTDDLEQRRGEDSLGGFESPDFATTRRDSIGWQNDFDLSAANRLSAGAMYYDERADTFSLGEVQTDVINAYLQDRIEAGRHTVVLAAGHVDHETFGGHATWNAEYGVQVGAATRLTAAAGTAFRAPDATDRFGFGGNPGLSPEESRNFELGLRHKIGQRQQVFANVFQNDIDELIEFVSTDPFGFDGELRNSEQARIRGIEAGYELHGASWQLRAEAIYQEPMNRTDDELLLRRARHNFIVSYVQSLGAAELGFDVLAAGERKDFGGIPMDSYVLANFTARYNFDSSWSAQASIENLFDEDYELARGYNTPDRGVFVALRFTPGK
jgi:vitamin B12 transporter